jgi:phosphoribosylaminoimidazole-succinocarboxamide synthase
MPFPIIEYYYKRDDLHDPMINRFHVRALGLCNEEELAKMEVYGLEINEVLKKFFAKRDINLVDFKLEFGRHKGEIILGDEISPDTCRYWDAKTGKKLDKDRFRRDLGELEETYLEILRRVNLED